MTIWGYLGLYLVAGIIALTLLDLITSRIRKRLKSASYDTQEKMTMRGSYIGAKQAIILTVLALWVFWPLVIYSAISSQSGGNDG